MTDTAALDLASLLCSRLCHDMLSPVGALSNGLELLREEKDPEMRKRCMELLEHVPDPASIVAACAALARPGGTVVVSTISRNLRAYLQAVIGAEYVLNLLPRGTHDYAKLIRPAELAGYCRDGGLHVDEIIECVRKGPLSDAMRELVQLVGERMKEADGGQPSKPDDLSIILFRKPIVGKN